MPLASTQKVVETKKMKDLLLMIQHDAELSKEDVEMLSDRAIDFIFRQASIEQENRRVLSIPSRERRGTSSFHGELLMPGFYEWLVNLAPWNKKGE